MTGQRITPFLFEGEITVRVIYRDDAPWFVAADVYRALGIKNAGNSLGALDEDEKGIDSIYTLGGSQEMLVISESGLFTLILRCREAGTPGTLPHRFRRWVTAEVLPSIRSEGQYQLTALLTVPETFKLRCVTEARQTFGIKAAAELWFQFGLPEVAAMRVRIVQGELF